jgi:hypothetical protein
MHSSQSKAYVFYLIVIPCDEHIPGTTQLKQHGRMYLPPEHRTDTGNTNLWPLHHHIQSKAYVIYLIHDGFLERRPSNWLSVSSAGDCFNDFPKLQEDDLRQLTLGVYQLKLAKSYSVEHLNTDGSDEMFVNKQDEGLLMGKIQSRHVSSRSHKLWIEYDDVMVKGWYCQCRSGARVVGTCAHVVSVVWFLFIIYLAKIQWHTILIYDGRYQWNIFTCVGNLAIWYYIGQILSIFQWWKKQWCQYSYTWSKNKCRRHV